MQKGIFLLLVWFACVQVLFGQDTTAVSKKVKILPVPSFGYAPETEYYIGAVGLFTFDLYDDFTRTSNAKIEFIYTWREQAVLDIGWNYFFREEKWFTQGMLRFSRYPDLYYGIGPNTLETDEFSYQSDRAEIEVSLSKKISKAWFFGGGIRYISYKDLKSLEEDRRLFTQSDPTAVKGVIVRSFSDTRKNLLNPKYGQYYLMQGSVNIGVDLFFKMNLDFRKYFTPEKTTFAFRLAHHANWGGAPFFDVPALGGDANARGYFFGRFRDRSVTTFQAEARRMIWGRLGLAGFGGISSVSPTPLEVEKSSFKTNIGGGLRFLIDREGDINLRLDYAIGQDGQNGFYISFGESF